MIKITLQNEEDLELLMRYCDEVFASDGACGNCYEISKLALRNDFEGFMSQYCQLSELTDPTDDELADCEKDSREAFQTCKRCIFAYVFASGSHDHPDGWDWES